MTKKVIGWVLLTIGVLIIAWGVWSSYNIFTAKKPVPQVFEIPEAFLENGPEEEDKGENAEKNGAENGSLSEAEEEERVSRLLREQIAEILPFDFITRFFNLIAWSIFTGILIIAGGKIAGIGIKLLAVKEVLVAEHNERE